MSKKNVFVQSSHVLNDDAGHPLSPGSQYSVSDGPLINQYIADGLLDVVEASADKAKAKAEDKTKPANTTRAQVTEPDNTSEENTNA